MSVSACASQILATEGVRYVVMVASKPQNASYDPISTTIWYHALLAGGFESGFDGSAGGGGQTREHAQLARSLGIEQLTVVVSKLDICNFSEQRFRDIKAVLLPFLKGCGFRPSSLQWLPAVGPTGQNLTKPPSEKQLSWFKVSAQSEYREQHTMLLHTGY